MENEHDFEQDINEVFGKTCYLPTSGYCVINCSVYLTVND